MPALRSSLRLALIVVAWVVSAATLAAPRTFVASTGSDANTCSLVLPCRAFARALTQTDTGGEIVILDSAGYGPVTIGKSVSITAPPGIYGGISVGAGQNGVVVNGAGISVALRGLRIDGTAGSNDGVRFQAGAELRIERCTIQNLGGIGIEAAAPGARLSVADTVVSANGSGVLVSGVDVASFDRLTSERNIGDGLFLLRTVAPAPGLRALVVDSVFASNGANGILMFQGAAQAFMAATIERTSFLDNGQRAPGRLELPGSRYRWYRSGARCIEPQRDRRLNRCRRGQRKLDQSHRRRQRHRDPDHRGTGISSSGNGAKVVSSRNTIYGGSIGLIATFGAAMFTSADNVLFDHTGADVSNTLTPLTLR